ncbi:MAG: family beta-propeller repeat protein [Schlesneria sp.]|nr:family beta-propeller repeat protein [Schlesneria sp.]
MNLLRRIIVIFAVACASRIAVAEDAAHFRQPVAIVVIDDDRIVTANQRSGSLTLIDQSRKDVVAEFSVERSLSDVVRVPGQPLLLVTDQANHQLIVIQITGDLLVPQQRLTVSPYPMSVRVSADGNRAFVASLWSRTITVVDLKSLDKAEQAFVRTIPLSFAPKEQLYLDSAKKLIVADAFGSKLAVLDPDTGIVDSVRELPAHSIRQLRLHPTKPRLMMSHQMLSRLAHTTFDDVHWGGLMVNCLRSLPLADVLNPKADLLKQSQLDYLGGPEQGAGDPAGFVITSTGLIAVALSGTDEIAVDDGNHLYAKRIKTGSRPTAMVLDTTGSRAFVVNTLSDSVTIIDIQHRTSLATISLGATPDLTAADRGERLFHSASLSHDRWFSCASCHVDGHSNGLLNDNFTDESFGTAKRVLSLKGVGDTAPYAWSGRFTTLAEQIQHSVKSTMQGDELSEEQTGDLEVYLRTLPPAPPTGAMDQSASERGARLFVRLDCNRCHTQPAYTSARTADVKLKDEQGLSKFNPPSLRGVSQNGPYFHDGRAETLSDVFSKFQHQLESKLTDDEVRDLVAYLNSL